MTASRSALPGTVRWARRLCFFVGGLYALSTAGLVLALVTLPPPLDPRLRRLLPFGVVFAVCAFGFLWAAVGTRERSRWGWRAGIGSYAALIAVDLAGVGGGRRVGFNTVLTLLGLWTVLAPSTRQWFNTTEAERRAAEEEDRRVRLARRRLTEEAPSLRDISFRDLPRRGPRD